MEHQMQRKKNIQRGKEIGDKTAKSPTRIMWDKIRYKPTAESDGWLLKVPRQATPCSDPFLKQRGTERARAWVW